MLTPLGAHNPRLALVRDLRSQKGRQEQRLFTIEGITSVREALATGVQLNAIYATRQGLHALPEIASSESRGTELFIIDQRSMRKISDLDSPSGVLAIAPMILFEAERLLREPGVVLALADINDPGNAGTLLRSAAAFGIRRVLFGADGVDPYHPKVVRAAMGALFRHRIGVTNVQALKPLLDGWQVTGLTGSGRNIRGLDWPSKSVIIVGNERHGLAGWEALARRYAAIPMPGGLESLNAAVAGSIAMYEATKRTYP